jgi:hypothetical protein
MKDIEMVEENLAASGSALSREEVRLVRALQANGFGLIR